MNRRNVAIPLLLWIVTSIAAYYVVQKPDLIILFDGLVETIWTLFVASLLLFNAYNLGKHVLQWMGFNRTGTERLLFSTGIGLGVLGLFGLWISAAQIAKAPILLGIQLTLGAFFYLRNAFQSPMQDLEIFRVQWRNSFSQFNALSMLAILLPLLLSFLLTLVPQLEAYDTPLYHLAQPAQILKDGGLRPFDNLAFWFPNVTENVYLWSLGMGSERATQIIHLAWGTLSILLLWHWSSTVWNVEIGRKALLLAASIPSLPILASSAYADMALIFYSLATLYSLTSYRSNNTITWLSIAGTTAGLAMGVKYTSFTTPLACFMLILYWHRKDILQAITDIGQFSIIALVVACSWYIRNAIIMGNPFYPFVFGGRYWDSFLTEWYTGTGTGIGWNLLEIIKLPIDVMLVYKDQTYFDARMGPLFLAFVPLVIWYLVQRGKRDLTQDLSMATINLFSALGFLAWTFGVINSSHLWQGRLLYPALIPFIISTSLGWDMLYAIDNPKLKVSYMVNVLISISIGLTLFSNSVFVIRRNPLSVAFGIQTREQYIERTIPSYASLIKLVKELPENARPYSLFEPRTYDLLRSVQPDVINSNFSHDLYKYRTTEGIIGYWINQGYTHLIVNNAGLNFVSNEPESQFTPTDKAALKETLEKLELVSQSPDGVYSIYKIQE